MFKIQLVLASRQNDPRQIYGYNRDSKIEATNNENVA
jgi:hypothetical protein